MSEDNVVKMDVWQKKRRDRLNANEIFIYSVGVAGSFRGIADVKGEALAFLNSASKNPFKAMQLSSLMAEKLQTMETPSVANSPDWLKLVVRYIAYTGVVQEVHCDALHLILFDIHLPNGDCVFKMVTHPIPNPVLSPYSAYSNDGIIPCQVASF